MNEHSIIPASGWPRNSFAIEIYAERIPVRLTIPKIKNSHHSEMRQKEIVWQ